VNEDDARAPDGVRVFVRDVQYPHSLVYEGIVADAHHWMLQVPTDKIPDATDVRIEIGMFPGHTAIELFWVVTK
jgi:hypothetical protein